MDLIGLFHLVPTEFLLVAGAHFLALLSPGPDFFLVARSALVQGWRQGAAVSLGIALVNGAYIALALGGVSLLQAQPLLFVVLKWSGCAYLAYVGWRCLRFAGRTPLLDTEANPGSPAHASRVKGVFAGFLSAILNPKNSLFYLSLFTLLPATPPAYKILYGLWMFTAVLLWDLAVAWGIGHPAVVGRFAARLGTLERGAGAALLLLAAGVATSGRGGD